MAGVQHWWLLCAVVSSVLQVGESGVDFHYKVWDPSGEAMSQDKLSDALGLQMFNQDFLGMAVQEPQMCLSQQSKSPAHHTNMHKLEIWDQPSSQGFLLWCHCLSCQIVQQMSSVRMTNIKWRSISLWRTVLFSCFGSFCVPCVAVEELVHTWLSGGLGHCAKARQRWAWTGNTLKEG